MPKLLTAALGLETLVLGALLTTSLDMYAHHRVETLGGVNIWGYRGPVMHSRSANEIRIAVVGGDLAFGWGVAASETLAANVRQLVAAETDRPGAELHPVTAVNLGALGLAPSDYAGRIEHYQYLRPDIICIVADADRPAWGHAWLPDARSAIWQRTGYAPMLPLVLEEKGWPATAAALRRVDAALGGPLGSPDADYVEALSAAVTEAFGVGAAVVVVLPPRVSDHDTADRSGIAASLEGRFGADPQFRLRNMAAEIGTIDRGLLLDGVNLSVGGHQKLATLIAPAVVELARQRPTS
jgi:hypothetical protein